MADEFDKFKAKLFENPKIKAEYDALAPERIERLITARNKHRDFFQSISPVNKKGCVIWTLP